MADTDRTQIDHPERLIEAIIGIVDELEENEIIDEDRAAELHSQIHRSIDTDLQGRE